MYESIGVIITLVQHAMHTQYACQISCYRLKGGGPFPLDSSSAFSVSMGCGLDPGQWAKGIARSEGSAPINSSLKWAEHIDGKEDPNEVDMCKKDYKGCLSNNCAL